ncbi:MAG3720 family protein [Mycoplasmopsis primatum]|uniref:MAG3720 family protein n=1 Tax=Mycoplasmopsis primatum TaxID=55604 RepID=UPI0004976D76|nr:hypothetical protein [Mycoplasmopsis primatum]
MTSIEKTNYFVSLYIKEKTIEYNFLEWNGSNFMTVFNDYFTYNIENKDEIRQKLNEIKSYLVKKRPFLSKKTKKTFFYSLIVDDQFANSTDGGIIVEKDKLSFDLPNNEVTNEIVKQYQGELKNNFKQNDNFVISYNTYLYELLNRDGISTKQYGVLPTSKKASKLVTYQMKISMLPNSNVSKLHNYFKSIGYEFNQVLLKSQCLDSNLKMNKFKLTVDFSWNYVSLIGKVNNVPFFYDKHEIKIANILNQFPREIRKGDLVSNLMLSALAENYDLFDQYDNHTLEKNTLNVLKNIIKELALKIKDHLQNEIQFPDVELLVYGKNTNLVSNELKNEIRNTLIVKNDNKDVQVLGTNNYFLGAAYLSNALPIKWSENMMDTIPLCDLRTPTINKLIHSFNKLVRH